MENELKLRKYRIGVLLAQYDERSQNYLRGQLVEKLGISRQMLSYYINSSVCDDRYDMSTSKLKVIAEYFKVDVSDLLTANVSDTAAAVK